jgi:hypothetical protein
MTASGQQRKLRPFPATSALPPKADIHFRECDVHFVPIRDIPQASPDGKGRPAMGVSGGRGRDCRWLIAR